LDPEKQPCVVNLAANQFSPLEIELVDLNKDGRMEILASNHRADDCFFEAADVPGRVYALEQPENGDIFGGEWTTHILLDNIRPQPLFNVERLAPGNAKSFYPKLGYQKKADKLPWIVVSGDESGKVYLMEPKDDFLYTTHVIFDINDFYGPRTTQTPLPDPFAGITITISTVGHVTVAYDEKGRADLYIPIFEAGDLFVFSFRKPGRGAVRIECLEDVNLQCPAPSPGG
jgi:hypothetical protein